MPSAAKKRNQSHLSFGWSVFLFTASLDPVKNREAVKAILIIPLVEPSVHQESVPQAAAIRNVEEIQCRR
jgi:hypothetical protein